MTRQVARGPDLPTSLEDDTQRRDPHIVTLPVLAHCHVRDVTGGGE